MTTLKGKFENRLTKLSRKGFRGYPVATVAYYGPDESKATKVAVGIIRCEGAEVELQHWYTPNTDARFNEKLTNEIAAYLKQQGAVSVAAVGKILGCPHEEGTDYPEGAGCPQCPYWADKDRWEGVAPRASKAEMLARRAAEKFLN
jgi:hypothetical protein